MADRFEALERQLAVLHPRALSRELPDRIAGQLAEPQPATRRFSDRVLAGFMSGGALAACVIVGVLTWETIPPAAPPGVARTVAATPTSPTIGQYQQALARASDPFALKVSMP